MAIVGEAHIIVRAITSSVRRDIEQGFSGLPAVGNRAGQTLGQAFTKGFNSTGTNNAFTKLSAGLRNMVPGADQARESFHALIRSSYALGSGITAILGGISAMIGGLGALAGSAGGAIATLSVLGNVAVAAGLAMLSAKLALGGVGKALSALNKPSGGSAGSAGSGGTTPDTSKAAAAAQKAYEAAKVSAAKGVQSAEESLARVIERNRDTLIDANNEVRDAQLALNEALKEGREEIQQIGFDAEDAALAESRASLELDKARETLLRTQDLPPNSRLRKEAELAYQEADLNLRKAKDKSADLNKEQDRLARTGVAGTEAVISATKALADAEAAKSKDIRDGLRDELDATQALNEAKAVKPELADTSAASSAGSAGSAGSGGVDPFAGLFESQIKFVKFLQSLKPLYDQLRKTAADALLPPLQEAIQILADGLFPTLNKGVGIVAASLGQAAISIANAVVEARNLSNLDKIFVASGPLIESFGRIIGSVFGIVLSILTASIPLAERFVGFLESKAGAFDDFLKADPEGLTNFFNTAGQIMADFGTIFGNIFTGIGAIIMANFGPGTGGQMMLDWLMTATGEFAALGEAGNMGPLKETFLGLAENAITVFQSIGALLSELGKLGADPNVGLTFAKLSEGAPVIGDILEKLISAAPAFAGVVVELVKFVDLLTDGVANSIFFDVIAGALKGLNDILANETVNKIATVSGQIAAFMLALGFLGAKGAFVFKYIAGSVAYLSKAIGLIGPAFGILWNIVNGFYIKLAIAKAKDMILTLRIQAMYAKDAIVRGAQLAAHGAKIVALGAIQAAAHVKEMAMNAAAIVARGGMAIALGAVAVAQGIATAAAWAFNIALNANPIALIVIAIAALVAGLVWFFTQTELGKEIWSNFVQFLTEAWTNIQNAATSVFTAVSQFLSDTWNNIVSFISDAVANVISFVSDNWGLLLSIIIGPLGLVIQWIVENWSTISQVFTDVWNTVVTFTTTAINNVWTIITAVGAAIALVWSTVWQSISDFASTIWDGIVLFVTVYIQTVQNVISAVVNGISKTWNAIWGGISSFFGTIWAGIVLAVGTYINLVQAVIRTVLSAISSIWSSIWNGISSFFSGIWNGILSAVRSFGTFFRDAFSGIAGFVENAFNGVLSAVRGPLNGIIGMVNNAIRSLNGLSVTIPDWVPGVGGQTWGLNLPTIPQLAKGGVIQPTRGGTLANIGEAGRPERVEPLDPDGLSKRDKAMIQLLSGGNTNGMIINVYPPEGVDASEVASIVSREISFQMRKGAVS